MFFLNVSAGAFKPSARPRPVVGSMRFSLLILAVVFASGCFKSPGNPESAVMVTGVPVVPVYKTATDSYLWAAGQCNGAQILEFTYSSALTPATTVSASCSAGKIGVQLSINSGDQIQTFKVGIVARIKGAKSKTFWTDVNYSPVTAAPPGYAVVSGGTSTRITDGASISSNASIGEPVGPATGPAVLTGAGMSGRGGIQGILDP